MSTRIEKDYYFQAAVKFENKFLLNMYDIKLSMLVETESIREQTIAMERVDYFLHNIIENVIFVDHTDNKAIDLYEKAGIKVCTTPDEPFDQIIAIVLLLKLNAILENKLYITDLLMGSKLSDGVRFSVVPEIATSVFKEYSWYNESSINIKHFNKNLKTKDKILKLFDENNWDSLGLCWKERNKKDDNIVVLEPEKNNT